MSDEMPVFVIKAKDRLAIKAVLAYQALCEDAGLVAQANEVSRAIREMMLWRGRNEGQIKNPDHKHVPAQPQLVAQEGTLHKVYDALRRAGLADQQIIDCVFDMQNNGIYFRETMPTLDVSVHASPGCACGTNGAGEVFVDPICKEYLARRWYLRMEDMPTTTPITKDSLVQDVVDAQMVLPLTDNWS